MLTVMIAFIPPTATYNTNKVYKAERDRKEGERKGVLLCGYHHTKLSDK